MLRLVTHPYYYQDESDSLLEELFWPFHHPHNHSRGSSSSNRPRVWSTALELQGFRPEEITTKCETAEDGKKQQLVVHARHVNGSDYNEMKRTVTLPEEIETEKLKLHFSKQGLLLIQAPYKEKKAELSNDFDVPSFSSLLAGSRTEICPADGSTGEKFRADFAVKGYKPEEIHIQQRENQIIVEAKQEKKAEGSGETTVSRQMRRVVSLPPGVRVSEFVSQFNESEGVLRLEAPYERPKEPESRKIQVAVTQDSLKSHPETPASDAAVTKMET